jgi:hypothetical protein
MGASSVIDAFRNTFFADALGIIWCCGIAEPAIGAAIAGSEIVPRIGRLR